VRAVVVNYNGASIIERCLEHLLATEWPRDKLEIVVVDNASSDESPGLVADGYPQVSLIRSERNTGFAGGTNLGIGDLRGVDHVALVNSDAFVTPGWLAPLVEALSAPKVGAACPKILFAPQFVELELEMDGDTPGGHDQRVLGVRVSGVRCNGLNGWQSTNFVKGFYWEEADRSVADEPPFRWSGPGAALWAPVPREAEPPISVELRLSADRDKAVRARCGSGCTDLRVGRAPAWYSVAVAGTPFDVMNNAGSNLVPGGHGADRGFRERDVGQYDQPVEVFAWCGAAVLLSGAYLTEVGIFCDRYFLYYEDFDLSWRGRSRGWRYVFAPGSVVHHMHAASTVEGSPVFEHYVRRNRLLTLVKNAPASLAAAQVLDLLQETRRVATEEVVRPLFRRERPHPDRLGRLSRAGVAFVKHLPHALRARQRIAARATVPRGKLMTWTEPR